jgi:hypothetical protein
MDNDQVSQTTALIRGPFELESATAPDTEEELLAVLAARIEEMLEKRPDYLLSLLYRLDVLEPKINRAMHPGAPEPPHIGLARLVLERQKQRIETKRTIKPEPLKDWEDWVL